MNFLDNSSSGFIEAIASSKRKSKEHLRVQQLVPENILENSSQLDALLDSYYEFMNTEEFIYQEEKEYSDVILDGRAVFRIPLSEKNNAFFTDDDGANSRLIITDISGESQEVALVNDNVAISNGNELPGSLASVTSQVGKTFTVSGLDDYNTSTATIKTNIKYWTGAGPSYVMNTIENAMDIDTANDNYLELIQKEIAAAIPRSITTDKRTLYKSIIDYYKIRGSNDSIEIFFRLLFNEEVEVTYPWDKTLIPSSGNWEHKDGLGLYDGSYIDNKGFVSYDIKLQDSLRYQKFSYNIRTGRNIADWEAAYTRLVHPAGFTFFGEILLILELTKEKLGEDIDIGGILSRKVLSAMPFKNRGVIGLEDIAVLIEIFSSVYNPSAQAKIHKTASLSPVIVGGEIVSVEIKDGGYGYSTAPLINVVSSDGTGASFTAEIGSSGVVENVIVNTVGSGYVDVSLVIDINSEASKVANVNLGPGYNKVFKRPPILTFSEPTSVDERNIPLATNVIAEGEFILETNPLSENYQEIIGFNVTNPGFGYVADPDVYISSSQFHEDRAKKEEMIKVIQSNLDITGKYVDPENNYYGNKDKLLFENEAYRFNSNRSIGDYGHLNFYEAADTYINKTNVGGFIGIKQ